MLCRFTNAVLVRLGLESLRVYGSVAGVPPAFPPTTRLPALHL